MNPAMTVITEHCFMILGNIVVQTLHAKLLHPKFSQDTILRYDLNSTGKQEKN